MTVKELVEKLSAYNQEALVQVVVLDHSKPKDAIFGEDIERFYVYQSGSNSSLRIHPTQEQKTCSGVLLAVERNKS